MTKRDNASERPASPLVDDAFIWDPFESSKEVLLSEEHVDYKWVDFESARKTLVWNGQRKGLEAVYEMITNSDDRMRWSKIEL